jgi:hypothetical protein
VLGGGARRCVVVPGGGGGQGELLPHGAAKMARFIDRELCDCWKGGRSGTCPCWQMHTCPSHTDPPPLTLPVTPSPFVLVAVEPSVAPQLVSLLPNMARLLQRGRDNTAAFQILEAYLLLQVSHWDES